MKEARGALDNDLRMRYLIASEPGGAGSRMSSNQLAWESESWRVFR